MIIIVTAIVIATVTVNNIEVTDTTEHLSMDDILDEAELRFRAISWDVLKENSDSDGHGTHCAATAAGKEYGIAPKAQIYGMEVLARGGGGSIGVVLSALNSLYELVSCGDGGLCQLQN